MRRFELGLVGCWLLSATSCIYTEEEACPEGERGCECYEDSSCESTRLRCVDDVCVRNDGDGDGDGAAGESNEGVAGSPPVEGSGATSSGGTGGNAEGAGGTSAGTGSAGSSATTPSDPVWPGFELELEEGTFWDFEWRSLTTNFGTGGSPSTGVFRLALGAPMTIDGVTMHELLVFGNPGEMAPRWTAIGFQDGALYGTDGEVKQKIFDANTSLWIGGGFFAVFPNEVIRARQGSFSNAVVSGAGIVVERSVETSDTVCDPDFGCVSGGDPDTLMVVREFYQDAVGPAGYYFQFTLDDGPDYQGTTTEDIGLVATSLRGDEGYFDGEAEPNDSVASASQALEPARVVIGSFSTTDGGFTESHTYVNPQGIEIGSATDSLQDCFDVDIAGVSAPSFALRWDADAACSSCKFSIVLYDAEQSPVSSTSTIDPDFSFGSVSAYLFDNQIAMYGNRYTLCVGTTSSSDIAYTLEF